MIGPIKAKPFSTLTRRAESEFVVNKSRFIGQGCPCETEDDALSFLAEARAARKDANHHCYAYIIGPNMGVMRYSDSGEPGGTAGLPIIGVMKARNVTNACVVVTRYFGGVLLGAGGLTRAYAEGASTALRACGVGTMHPSARHLLEAPYSLLGKIEYFLAEQPVIVEDKSFAETVIITLLVKCADEAAFATALSNASEGRVHSFRVEERHHLWEE